MPFSFFSTRLGGKLNDAYPNHIKNWASRLKASVERDDLADLKRKYEGTPLRRATPKAKPKNRAKNKP